MILLLLLIIILVRGRGCRMGVVVAAVVEELFMILGTIWMNSMVNNMGFSIMVLRNLLPL